MTLVALVALAVVGHAAQPYAPSPDRPSLVGLRIDPAPGRTEISIVVDGAPPIRVREPLILDDRARVEIEIPGAAIRVNRPIYVGPPTGGILALRAMSGAGGARVLIDLPVGRRYDVHTAPNGLLVTIENHGAPATLWITGVRGYGSPPRIVPAAAPAPPAPAAPARPVAVQAAQNSGADAAAPATAQAATAPAAPPATSGAPHRVGEAAAAVTVNSGMNGATANAAAVNAATANSATADSVTANSATPPIPRPARRARAAAEHPALTFAPPTAAQAIVLLALLALPSVLLALLRRRGRAAAPAAPAQGETGAPKLRTPRRFRAPRAARRPAAEPGALWAARTLAHTDTPAVEVARRTGLSQDAVLLLRRAAGARAEEAAGGGRNVRAAVPARGDGSNAR